MRKTGSAILLIMFLAQSFAVLFHAVWYYTHQEEITLKFCVNKDKPQMHCKGSCHFAITLSRLEPGTSGSAAQPDKRIESISAFDYFENIEVFTPISDVGIRAIFSNISQLFPRGYPGLCEPPPESALS